MQYNQYVETDNTTEERKKYNMDTKDTAMKTAPSVAPAKPAPVPKPAGEPGPEEPVPSVPLSGRADDSLDGLGAAFSGLSVGPSEGKEKEKKKEAVEMGAEGVHSGHDPTDEVPFEDKPSESAPSGLNTLQHPLQPHSQAHIQQHPLLVCLTPPMVWTHSGLRHLWQLQSANQWHPAPPTLVSVSLCSIATLRP